MKTTTRILLAASLLTATAMNAPAQLAQPVKAAEFLGRDVNAVDHAKVGSLKDLAIDLENGRIVEAVIAQGGFLGIDTHFVVIPVQDLAFDAAGKTAQLNVSVEKLQAAPAVDFSRWNEASTESSVENAYQYYNLVPFFKVPEHQAHNPANPTYLHLGQVERASCLLGMETINHELQRIGKVRDLIVDFPQGRVVEVIVDSGHYLGIPDELSAVPPQALHYQPDRKDLMLVATKSEITAAPHFSSRAWPVIDAVQATRVYQAYHVLPYFLPIGGNTAAPSASASDIKVKVASSTAAN
jgi:sporulation protein YlmC with PRC-barrel domain